MLSIIQWSYRHDTWFKIQILVSRFRVSDKLTPYKVIKSTINKIDKWTRISLPRECTVTLVLLLDTSDKIIICLVFYPRWWATHKVSSIINIKIPDISLQISPLIQVSTQIEIFLKILAEFSNLGKCLRPTNITHNPPWLLTLAITSKGVRLSSNNKFRLFSPKFNKYLDHNLRSILNPKCNNKFSLNHNHKLNLSQSHCLHHNCNSSSK